MSSRLSASGSSGPRIAAEPRIADLYQAIRAARADRVKMPLRELAELSGLSTEGVRKIALR